MLERERRWEWGAEDDWGAESGCPSAMPYSWVSTEATRDDLLRVLSWPLYLEEERNISLQDPKIAPGSSGLQHQLLTTSQMWLGGSWWPAMVQGSAGWTWKLSAAAGQDGQDRGWKGKSPTTPRWLLLGRLRGLLKDGRRTVKCPTCCTWGVLCASGSGLVVPCRARHTSSSRRAPAAAEPQSKGLPGWGWHKAPRPPKAGVTQGDGGPGRDELWVQSRSSQHQTFMVPLLFELASGGKSPCRGFPPLGYLGPQGGRAHNGAGGALLLACSGGRGAFLCPVPAGTHPAGPGAVTVGSRWWHPRWDLQVPQAAGAPLVSAFRTAGEQVQT